MDMTGERRIPAPRERVWDALNDPAVLKTCIPGCESLEKLSPTDMKATAAVKIGPIAARFTGKVQLSDLDPPNAYTISGEGQGGVAGFAKGGARVALSDDGPFTLLRYDVKAQVGGKIAQLGARLIDATAKQMADSFFNRFTAEVSGPAEGIVTAETVMSVETVAPVQVTTPPETIVVQSGPRPQAVPPAEAGAEGLAAPIAALTGGTAGPTRPTAGTAPREATVVGPGHAANVVAPARQAAAPAAISVLDLMPREPMGFPIVAWIGGAIWLCIFFLVFSAYL